MLPSVLNSTLGKYIFNEWSDASGIAVGGGGGGGGRASVAFSSDSIGSANDAAAWDGFKASAAFDLYAKYMALGDKLAAEKISHSLFAEARPLGKGAFGAVYLVFKKV